MNNDCGRSGVLAAKSTGGADGGKFIDVGLSCGEPEFIIDGGGIIGDVGDIGNTGYDGWLIGITGITFAGIGMTATGVVGEYITEACIDVRSPLICGYKSKLQFENTLARAFASCGNGIGCVALSLRTAGSASFTKNGTFPITIGTVNIIFLYNVPSLISTLSSYLM